MITGLISVLLFCAMNDAEMVEFHSAGSEGCSFTVNIGRPEYRRYDDRWYPVIEGMANSFIRDEFMLPVHTVFVPVPPGTDPQVSYSVTGRRAVSPPEPLMVTPVPRGTGLDTEWMIPPASRGAVPEEIVSIQVFRLAGTRVAAVTVSPFAIMETGSIPTGVTVRLSWPSHDGGRAVDSSLLLGLCHSSLSYWPIGGDTGAVSPFWGRPWAKMGVSESGVYVVTGEELEEAGVSVSGTPSATLRVLTGPGRQFDLEDPAAEHKLNELPVEVIDGGDGIFDDSDTLKFVGMSLERFENPGDSLFRVSHRFAESNVYWLTWGGENGLRVDTVAAMPDGSPQWGDSLRSNVWQEHDYFWVAGQESRTGWVWSQLFQSIPGYFYFSTPSADGSGTVTVSLIPEWRNSGPHSVQLEFNDQVVADTAWTGSYEVIMTVEGLDLEPSMNLLKVTAVEEPGKLYIDYFMADYPRGLSYAANRMLWFTDAVPGRYGFSLGGGFDRYCLMDLTDPMTPVRLEGELSGALLNVSLDVDPTSRFWMESREGYKTPEFIIPAQPGRIVGTGMEGDVAAVVADELMEAAGPLEAIYAARGLSLVMVSAEEVYDEFGQGLRDPGAIRSFFRYTQDVWGQPARALLLVGDGSFDPMMHVTSSPTLIPVFLLLSGENGDNLDDMYVTAHEDGLLPEVPVSRITASSPTELSAYLTKVMTYDGRRSPGQWENRIVLAADDEWGNSLINEYDHTENCEQLADSIIPASLDRDKFYMIEYPWPPGTTPSGTHPEKPMAREDFIETLTRGCSSMMFFGHGSYGQLAHEKLLVSSDVYLIDNGPRQPVMIFASCDLGHFDMSSGRCLAEDFHLMPASGSIVSIGATRYSFSGPNSNLFNAYYAAQYGPQGFSAGDALWAAKVQIPDYYYNSRYYVLLGDGGIHPVHPSSSGCSFQVQGDTLFRGRLNSVSGSFQNSFSGFINVTESGSPATYSGLGTGSITYLRYGSSVYRGLVSGEETNFDVSFFLPLQADTGSYARGSSVGISGEDSESAWREWADVSDDGSYAGDSLPPQIEMWLGGHRGESVPDISGETVLHALLTDSSGICTMGGGAGRSILLSLDEQGFDISDCFTYHPDSYSSGEIEYPLPEMIEGEHTLVMVAWDGMGNAGRDTLEFNIVQAPDQLLSDVFVYPNPGSGQRCFSFHASSPGSAAVRIYTVAGRCIWSRTVSCGTGYNQVLWNGLDMDNDPPASGAYVYRLEFTGSDGTTETVTDILAVTGGT